MNIELITPDYHMVSRHDELWQRCILRENTFILKFSERSSYNATVNQSKIRCIEDKHHMQINISDMIWSSSSCASRSPSLQHHHDHHRHRRDTLISIIASLSSRQSYASTTIATA